LGTSAAEKSGLPTLFKNVIYNYIYLQYSAAQNKTLLSVKSPRPWRKHNCQKTKAGLT